MKQLYAQEKLPTFREMGPSWLLACTKSFASPALALFQAKLWTNVINANTYTLAKNIPERDL